MDCLHMVLPPASNGSRAMARFCESALVYDTTIQRRYGENITVRNTQCDFEHDKFDADDAG